MDNVVEAAKNAPGQRQELESGVRKHHGSAATMEQGSAEDLFEVMNLRADRRLSEIERFGGGGELVFVGHGDETSQLLNGEALGG
jgi:hypothetical protein